MKIKITFLAVVFVLTSLINSYAQLPNQNTYLLKNLNEHNNYYSACWGYVAPDGREYAFLGCFTGTSFVDITDTSNIHEVDFVSGVTSQWREMKTYSHYAYIVSQSANTALQIVDLQYLPDSVRLVKTWSYSGFTKAHTISQSGHYLYLNGGNAALNGGVIAIDVSNPENPVKKGQWTTEYVHDCRVLRDTIWAANIYSGKISIINATNKNNLQFIRNWTANQPVYTLSTHNCAITDDRKYILTTSENGVPGKLGIWNIEYLNNITFVRNWQPTDNTTSIVHNVEIYGDYAIVAYYSAGIRIVNIEDPVNPVEAAWYDTYPLNNETTMEGCWGVYKFPSGKIIGSDMVTGLYVIKSTITDLNYPPAKLKLKAFSEGLFDASTNRLSRKDTVKVYLRSSSSPFSLVDSALAVIDSISLEGMFKFYNTATGRYYLVVKHFNSIETWSKTGGEYLVKEGQLYNYDFSSSSSKAYGNNLILKGLKYCMYSGDINESGAIDLDDVLFVYNDASDFKTGIQIKSDLSGDNTVDLSDLTIVFNNSNNFISVRSPMIAR